MCARVCRLRLKRVTATRQQEPTLGRPISRNLGFVTGAIWATFRYDLPAQPVNATPSNQLIRQYFLYGTDLHGRTLASRPRYSDQFEIEEVFGSWLRKTIATLKEVREGSRAEGPVLLHLGVLVTLQHFICGSRRVG